MEKLEELVTALIVSSIIGLAISYLTILIPFIINLNFLESVAIYHFWIHIASAIKKS